MSLMLAEDIGGWLLAAGLTFGAIIATILAIVAALAAKKGNRFAAIVLTVPGFLVGISAAVFFGYTAIVGNRQFFWLLIAFPPLIVSGLVTLAAWSPSKK
jgi:Na+/proline symporter